MRDLQRVTATVPNAFLRVFVCSELGTRCRLDHVVNLNPPVDPDLPTVFANRYVTQTCQPEDDDGPDKGPGNGAEEIDNDKETTSRITQSGRQATAPGQVDDGEDDGQGSQEPDDDDECETSQPPRPSRSTRERHCWHGEDRREAVGDESTPEKS